MTPPMKNLARSLALALPLALLAAACGVNEMPQYAERVAEGPVALDTAVDGPIALKIAEPPPIVVGEEGEAEAIAVSTTEAFLVDRLTQRITAVSPRVLGDRVSYAFAQDVERALPWRLAHAGQSADTRFLTSIEDFGVTLDAYGRASVQYNVRVEGWYIPDNRKIYDQWHYESAPLERYLDVHWHPHSGDPVMALAEREYNLLVLLDLPPGLLQEAIYRAAERAAAEAVVELVDDTFAD